MAYKKRYSRRKYVKRKPKRKYQKKQFEGSIWSAGNGTPSAFNMSEKHTKGCLWG